MTASRCSVCDRAIEDVAGVCLITYWWINGKPVCKECAKKMKGRCPVCGEIKGWCKHKEIEQMSFELKEQPAEQLEEYEKRINEIPLVIDPCKQCKVYKKHNGYDIGDRLVNGVWKKGYCDDCCWCYDSKFEMK